MAALSIRGLDDDVRDKLRVRAARHGRSMEAEARAILVHAANETERRPDLVGALLEGFGSVGGVELDIPVRDQRPRAPDFSE